MADIYTLNLISENLIEYFLVEADLFGAYQRKKYQCRIKISVGQEVEHKFWKLVALKYILEIYISKYSGFELLLKLSFSRRSFKLKHFFFKYQ